MFYFHQSEIKTCYDSKIGQNLNNKKLLKKKLTFGFAWSVLFKSNVLVTLRLGTNPHY